MEKSFYRVRSTKDIIITVVLVVAGCVLVLIPSSVSINITGFFMMFAGLILFFVLRTAYRDSDTNTTYCKRELYFPQNCRENVLKAVSTSPSSVNMTEENNGKGIRMDIYYSKKEGKAFVQMLEYVPYKYEEVSPFYKYDINSVGKLIR
ncbi:MAG: hypothetical protein ACI3ZN_02785 [Candidatus Cryptobacteroides sp.]